MIKIINFSSSYQCTISDDNMKIVFNVKMIVQCVIPVSIISEISSSDVSLLSNKLLIPSSPKKASKEAVES